MLLSHHTASAPYERFLRKVSHLFAPLADPGWSIYRARLTIRHTFALGADPNAPDEHGRTPLQNLSVPVTRDYDGKAVIHETGIHLLLEHGASVMAADPEGETPLLAAAFGASLHIFQHFLRVATTRNALSAANSHGETLLHYAAAGANVGVVRSLLESGGPDVNATNSNGWTPLITILAAPTGWQDGSARRTADDTVEIAQLLLLHGASATAVTAEGWSALHCLARHRNKPGDIRFSALAEALIQKGAPVNTKARSLNPDWQYKAEICEGYRWGVRFPWGFRVGRLAEAAPEGVFSAEATTPFE